MSKNTTGTPEQQAMHKEAVRLRKMTDEQLVNTFRTAQEGGHAAKERRDTDKVKKLLKLLSDGECKGVKGATAYKITEFAKEKGLLS